MESRMTRGAVAAIAALATSAAGCRLETRAPARSRSASVLAAAADSAAVLAELEAYYRDFSARDWVAFGDHFWPGADITTIWRPPGEDSVRVVVTSIPDFVAQAPRGPGSRQIFEERMLEARVVTFGDLAQAWVRYHARFGDPGAVAEWEGRDAFTLLRQGGRWRIVELAFVGDDAGS
jgi:hypothetical protein